MTPAHRALAVTLVIVAAILGCDRRVADHPSSAAAGQPIVAVSAGAAPLDLGREPLVREIAESYTHLTRVTKEPVPIDPEFSGACAPAVTVRWEESQQAHGPHAKTSLTIYMNPPAAEAFAARPAKPYPVGSVIVKEKRAFTSQARDGVGGMVKRPPGYDPQHGDWEYFYFQDPARIESGRIAACVQCHSGAAGRDHVFGDWAPPASADQ